MAQLKSDEEMGDRIWELYSTENLRAGEMLQAQVINVRFQAEGERADDLIRGVNWLLENGLLEQKSEEESIFYLTESGFERM